MNLSKKTALGSLLAVPLLIVLAWWGLFEYGVSYIESRIEDARVTLQKKGYEVSYDTMDMSGSPLQIQGVFTNLKVKKDNGLYQFQIPQLELSIKPWNYREIDFVLANSSALVIPALSVVDWSDLVADDCRGTLYLNSKNKAERVKVFTESLTPRVSGTPVGIKLQSLQCDVEGIDDILGSTGSLSFQIFGLDQHWLHDRDIRFPLSFKTTYTLSGVGKGVPFESLESWSQAGGNLNLEAFQLKWGAAQIEGHGSLSLDQKMRPRGSLHASITGYESALDILVETGQVKKKNAEGVMFALSLILGKPELGEPQVEVPLTLQKGYLRVGPAKLLKLKPVDL